MKWKEKVIGEKSVEKVDIWDKKDMKSKKEEFCRMIQWGRKKGKMESFCENRKSITICIIFVFRKFEAENSWRMKYSMVI